MESPVLFTRLEHSLLTSSSVAKGLPPILLLYHLGLLILIKFNVSVAPYSVLDSTTPISKLPLGATRILVLTVLLALLNITPIPLLNSRLPVIVSPVFLTYVLCSNAVTSSANLGNVTDLSLNLGVVTLPSG